MRVTRPRSAPLLAAPHGPPCSLPTPQEVTPNHLALFKASEWWGRYAAAEAPRSAPYFTLLLARADVVGPGVTSGSFRRSPFPASQMGGCLLCACA